MADSSPSKNTTGHNTERGVESQILGHSSASDQSQIIEQALAWPYRGSGTTIDPFQVGYVANDQQNPMLFPEWRKWILTAFISIASFAVAFVSAMYSGMSGQIMATFHASETVVTLGLSVFVLGFAVGPLIWAPLSELIGRKKVLIWSYAAFTIFNACTAASSNIESLILLRFFAGAFGSAMLTNAGGIISDIFPATQRGIALSFFTSAPFIGPTLGPLVGGYLGDAVGFRWVQGIIAAMTGLICLLGVFILPETYPPVILRLRAQELAKITGKVYRSSLEIQRGSKTFKNEYKIAFSRPWMLLFREPIVLLLSIYLALIYGTLYMLFGAFSIIFQEQRGYSPGLGGVTFLGVTVGMVIAIAYTLFDNKRYAKISNSTMGKAPPEARLPPAMVGSVFLPIGLFWFAWTNSVSRSFPPVLSLKLFWSSDRDSMYGTAFCETISNPAIVPLIGTVPFGFGMVVLFLSSINYLIDSYVMYASSVFAASSVLRSLFGAAFPLFTRSMYQNLGIHWASSVPAFLALACVPFPFWFYRYGRSIRMRCEFASQAAKLIEQHHTTT